MNRPASVGLAGFVGLAVIIVFALVDHPWFSCEFWLSASAC